MAVPYYSGDPDFEAVRQIFFDWLIVFDGLRDGRKNKIVFVEVQLAGLGTPLPVWSIPGRCVR
jgi:hypothetical protein